MDCARRLLCRRLGAGVTVWAALAGNAPAAAADVACTPDALVAATTPPDARLACARTLLASPDRVDTEILYATLKQIAWAQRTVIAPDPRDLETVETVAAELERRGAMRPADRRNLRMTLLLFGRLDEAAQDAAAHPTHAGVTVPRQVALPGARGGDARYWRWDADADVLREQSVDLRHGTYLIVVASPGCHFCDEAIRDSATDPLLAALFRRALWLSRPDSHFGQADYERWRSRHPDTPMLVMLDVRGWPMPEVWATPQFEFVRDGRVVRSVEGWSPKSRAAVTDAARELGFTSSNALVRKTLD